MTTSISDNVLNALPLPVLTIGPGGEVVDANHAAETFFDASIRVMRRQRLGDLLPFDSPALALVDEVRRRGAGVSEHRIDLSSPRYGSERRVDMFATPLGDEGSVVILLQERTIADKMDRQLTHRGAARSLTALGAMLAHEIKNPLSGIRGAAQLLEQSLEDNNDRMLTRLICDETDRIVSLVERMEVFGDERPLDRGPVNVNGVLDHVRRLATSGFARHVRVVEAYDPSLPPVHGNRDQLVQVCLNLLKNAAEAIGLDTLDGEIVLSTAYRAGIRLNMPGSGGGLVALPIEVAIRDNGPGVPQDLLPHLFDPFVTTKAQGSGLGLALVAKIVGAHGGVVECDPAPRRTTFRVLLPMHRARDGRDGEL